MLYPEKESSTIEFKREIPKSDQMIKTLIGFCNQHGGKLVIGVNNDREIVGLSEMVVEDCLEWAEKSVYEASFPPIIPRVSLQRLENKTILIIEVSSGMNKPYYKRSERFNRTNRKDKSI